MAGSMVAVIPSQHTNYYSTIAIRERWEVQYSRFFRFPPSQTSLCSNLVPLPPKLRKRLREGSWISSSSPALLQLVQDPSNYDVILSVFFQSKIQEEHYVSKLQLCWPQVTCISGFPSRGTRAVFVCYRDCEGEVQKFALRFSTIYETESFMNALKDILKDGRGTEPVSTEFASEISSQSELTSSNRPPYRESKDFSNMSPVQTYTPEISSQSEFPSSNRLPYRASIMSPVQTYTPELPLNSSNSNEAEQHSHNWEAMPAREFEGNFAALPPSFSSLLTNCCSNVEQAAAEQAIPEEVHLKSQIMKYMENSSFQDMLIKVEKVINELGGDLAM